MGLAFNVTIAYAVELPEGESYDHLEGDGLSILTEGEIGSRQFLGKNVEYFDEEHVCTAPFELPTVEEHIKEKLKAIAIEHGFDEPQLWTIGCVS